MNVGGAARPKGWRKPPLHRRRFKRFETTCSHYFDTLPPRFDGADPRAGIAQNQSAHTLWVIQCERLRDQAAYGYTAQHRLIDFESIEHAGKGLSDGERDALRQEFSRAETTTIQRRPVQSEILRARSLME